MKKRAKSTKARSRKTALNVTCEILPPGTLKRKDRKKRSSYTERWNEIIDICAEVIAEESL